MTLYELDGKKPEIDPSAYVAPTAVIVGDVVIGKNSSVWFQCVIRGDDNAIKIGSETNIQDMTFFHSAPQQVLSIGDRVTIGHGCIIHGCTIEDDSLIGMGAVIMTGAKIGTCSIVAAGAVVTENTEVPPFSMVGGVPAQVIHRNEESVQDFICMASENYVDRSKTFGDKNRFKTID